MFESRCMSILPNKNEEKKKFDCYLYDDKIYGKNYKLCWMQLTIMRIFCGFFSRFVL